MPSPLAIVINTDKSTFSVKPIEIPQHEADEVLVKVHSAAQNPTDWKTVDYGMTDEGYVLGCNYAGIVEAVGSDVTKAKVGDRVAGFVHGGSLRPGHGSYAQVVRVDGSNLFRIPPHVSYDEAATYGVAFLTAALGLYQTLGLPLPYSSSAKHANGEFILIWGGATSVGNMAIQLAKLSGYTVITTASPKNRDYLQFLGADHVLSYSEPTTPSKIREITGNGLRLAYDTVSEEQSTAAVLDSLSDSQEKKDVVILLPLQDKLGGAAETKSTKLHLIIAYSLLAKEDVVVWGFPIPANKENYEFSVRTYELLERLLQDGKMKHQRIRLLGGLEQVEEGIKYMKAGKVSGEKIVYRPLETKA